MLPLWLGGPIDDPTDSLGDGVVAFYAVIGHAGWCPGSDAFARLDTPGGNKPEYSVRNRYYERFVCARFGSPRCNGSGGHLFIQAYQSVDSGAEPGTFASA